MTASKLSKIEIILHISADISRESSDLIHKFSPSTGYKIEIIILHAEIYFVHNFKKINLELHYAEQRSFNLNIKRTIWITVTCYISTHWMPQTEEFNIVGLNERDGIKVVEFFFGESKCAEVVNLSVNFFHHFRSEYNTFVTTFEEVCAVEVGVSMKHDHIHIKLVKISIQ